MAATEQPARLEFPFSFASAMGPCVARRVVARAQAEFPGPAFPWVFDCDGEAGLAHAALHAGIPVVRFSASGPALAVLRAIAFEAGSQVETQFDLHPVLDLAGCSDPFSAVFEKLQGAP